MKNMPILLSGLLLMWSSEVLAQTAQPVLVSDTHSLTKTAAANLPDAPAPASNSPAPGVLVRSTVQVNAQEQTNTAGRNAPEPFHATAAEILSSAGTFGDMSRYLQLFPGVVFNSDESDDVLVRGGNPLENLFLVDGIEVPNINHITTEASTGGLVSMIDTAALENVDLRTGGYDASYEERLSSVVDIHTREVRDGESHTEGDFGFIGAGGISEWPLPNGGSLLLSGHRSLLNLFTNDIGLDGVPIYSNALARARWKPTQNDEITLLSLGGMDSIDITPEARDLLETSQIQEQYNGWRLTGGVRWQHLYSPGSFGTLTLSNSEQQEHIEEQDQLLDDTPPAGGNARSDVLVPVYAERTLNGTIALRYDDYLTLGPKLTLITGIALHDYRINYNIAQPQGQQSVLSVDPARTDADSFAPDFSTEEEGAYAEATWHVVDRWSVSAGERAQIFQFGGYTSFTPRASSAFLLSAHTGLHASFGEYAQMPPFAYLTAWPQNYRLLPIHARHIVAGIDLYNGRRGRLGVEAYQKNYRDYPVSTEYPTISLANLVDTLGQQFLWLPMTSQGTGIVRGVELFGETRLQNHLFLQANVAYARAVYAALDGVLRPGNFDFPIVANVAGSYRPERHDEGSVRYEYSTGRPYTPYLLEASAEQDRPIYDVSQINALRGPFYSRLDFQINHTFFLGSRRIVTYVGLQNAFNRENLLGYFWMPRLLDFELENHESKNCDKDPGLCLSGQYQMKRFPNFGVRYVF
jgi:hypothetical protein